MPLIPQLRRGWIAYVVLGGTLLLTTLSCYNAIATARTKDQLRFENEVSRTRRNIQTRLETYILLLRAGGGLFAANNRVSTQDFKAYVDQLDLKRRYPGVQEIGYSVRVGKNEIPVLTTRLQNQGINNFQIRPTSPPRPEYYPVIYLEPLDRRNQVVIGFDMFSESNRREAIVTSRDSGKATATGRVTLIQEIDKRKQSGFLIYIPIYRDGKIPSSIAGRREALQGFIYSPFRSDDLLTGIFSNDEQPAVDFHIYDGSIKQANLLYRSDNPASAYTQPKFRKSETIDVAGRFWQINFTSRPELENDSETHEVPYILFVGLVFSLVLFGVTRSQIRARSAAELAAADFQQSERRFRTLIEQSPLSTQIFAADGRLIQVNQAWEKLWGVTIDRLEEYNILQDQQLLQKGIMPYIQQAFAGIPVTIPATTYDPNLTLTGITSHPNSLRWVQAYIYPVKDEANNVREVVLLHEDITERKLAEAALQKSNQRMAMLYAMSSTLLLHEHPKALISSLFSQITNHLHLEFYFNYLVDTTHQKLRLHAYNGVSEATAQQVEWLEFGNSICGMVASQRQPRVVEAVQQSSNPESALIRSLGITAYACYPLVAQGRLIGTLSFGTCNRISFDGDELALMQVVCEQVATALERTRLVAELQQQTVELTQANRMKDEFLAVLSHELRTPLNAMLGWTKLLLTRKYDEQTTARALETIDRNTKSLAQLIEDILDVSRIITGKLQLNLRPVNLIQLVLLSIDTLRPTANAKDIVIETQLDLTSGLISGDTQRLQQVFANLLSNAIKFTPPQGRVKVHLHKIDSAIEIQIIDTGVGINPEFLPYVFDRFRQADASSTRSHGGLGLGLAIVRHLVELHGGKVAASSLGHGQGATFTVQLPLLAVKNQEEEIPITSITPSLLTDVRVLIVDDEADARDLVTKILEEAGAIVTAAWSATSALQALPSGIDILVSDIGMPGEDGYVLIRKIRTLTPQQGGQIPAIALTAYAGIENQNQAIAAGFQKHLTKPVDPNELVESIATLMNKGN